MDCVVIYHDPKTCVPEVLAARKRASIEVPVAARGPETARAARPVQTLRIGLHE
jgi:hypothetical protein